MKYIIGIDEAGRGPLAGPVAVGVVALSREFDWKLIPGVGDSKKITSKNREFIFRRARDLKNEGLLDFAVCQVSANIIDKKGIVGAINLAMARGLNKLNLEAGKCDVRLDGALRAPSHYHNQTTIIRGDASEPIIGLASILAKVTRDQYMLSMHRRYPNYEFDQHKGYGTLKHRENIKKYGLSVIHRVSFCHALQK